MSLISTCPTYSTPFLLHVCHDQPLHLLINIVTKTICPYPQLNINQNQTDNHHSNMVTDDKHTHETIIIDSNHQKPSPYTGQDTHRTVATTIVVVLLLIAITALVLWLVYRPHNPRFFFTVVGVTVFGVNTSSPPVITSFQLTFLTRNPNDRVSIYYDHLKTFLLYKNQPITPTLMLPPLHHKRDSTVAVTPVWPLSPAVVNGLTTDEAGVVSLRMVLTGKLRWKAGCIRTGHKGVYVGCDMTVGLKIGTLGQVPLVGPSVCRVDI
ncbi:NDR1/HIN1-like protein 1 [Bidens hawaiensis]|uniref:NDR1/HIN1-like protein 1 n=1 Tax=Bidens hawaiensis TaxID=980011 RepID=UPI0040492458